MQTFLPYPDFRKSAQCLDYKRLGKQRVEAWQIYKALTEENYGWKNHPVVKMWVGYESALALYGLAMCQEWIWRGYRDVMLERFAQIAMADSDVVLLPPWFGDEVFHAAMRSNLLRKDKEFYSKYGWAEPDNLPYVWGGGER